MNELTTSSNTNLEFHRYFNKVLYDFSSSENILKRDYEPRECNLLFMIKNTSCNYALEFEKNQFFFKINFEIDNNPHLDLRNRFYGKLQFLISDNRFCYQNENSIVLKSQIDEKLIERAHIIFVTERLMKSYFFSETKIAMEEIVSLVFEEFKETMHQVWKTIIENFEMITPLKCFVETSNKISKDRESHGCERNPYNLPPTIEIFYNSYNKQKLEQKNNEEILLRKGKSWIKRIYIFMKKLKTKYK